MTYYWYIRSHFHISSFLNLDIAFNQSTEASRFGQLNRATCVSAGVISNQVAMLDVSASLNQSTGRNFNPTSNHSTIPNICLPPGQPPNPDIVNYPETCRACIAFCQFYMRFSRSNQNSCKRFWIFKVIIIPMILNQSMNSLISRKV